jgi:hypothetical protein
MSLLDKASLIVTPNAYKESKLYSVVPSSGAGDMDVVRATTATRVNSAGLIEVVPRNLLTYSNTFTNAVWANGGYGNIATVIANDIISPDGLMNGSKITFSAGVTQARLIQQTSVINGGIYQASIFVKYGNKNTIDFYCDAAITGLFATFNFTTKVLTASGVSNTIVTELPNGWFRLQYTYTAPSATSQIGFISNIGADGFVYAYGGQAEQGSTTTEYFPTTTRLNIPRIDYTNGSCPSLLVEPQRTNLYFPSIPSSSGGGTYTLNDAISPDGTQNASSFVPSGFGVVYSNSISTTVQTYTFSVYLKGTVNGQKVGLGDNGNILNNFTITTSWQRYTFTFTGSVQNTPFYLLSGNYFSPAENNKFYIYGAQLEVGSYATSLIPTQASSVTRNADVISKTGISSLIGQTEGTIFWDATNLFTSGSRSLALIYTSLSSFFQIYLNSSNQIRVDINGSFLFLGGSINANTQYKIAFAYKSGNYALYLNGVQIAISTSTTIPSSLNDLYIGNSLGFEQSGSYKSVQLYKTRLTNDELTSLTTL